MARICLNTRDNLVVIDLDKVAVMQADGNYTNVTYIGGQKMMISQNLSKMEDLVKQLSPKGFHSGFVRLGRSVIINQSYLYAINTLKGILLLSDFSNHVYRVSVPKPLLKEYKQILKKQYQER